MSITNKYVINLVATIKIKIRLYDEQVINALRAMPLLLLLPSMPTETMDGDDLI